MKKHHKNHWLLAVIGALVAAGCARPAPRPVAPFAALDLSPKLKAGELVQNTDNFLVVLDSSGSMAEPYKGSAKLDLARNFVGRMNQTIPDIRLKAGLRKFAGKYNPFADQTDLVYGVSEFKKPGIDGALGTVVLPYGDTPLALAIQKAGDDLQGTQGRIAAIIVSDGNGTIGDASDAAKLMKKRFGDRLCIFPVVVGNDPQGKIEMERIAREGSCGFAINEEATRSSDAMANFVESVFFAKVGDQDGDSVLDTADRCPDTPRGTRVDTRGCPVIARAVEAPKAAPPPKPMEAAKVMDSDGDGVLDNADSCPGTPKGAQVDESGCWVIIGVRFDTNKADIKPIYYSLLDKVTEVLEKNPTLRVEVQGHTDSTGTAQYNMSLSQKRAKAVAEYFASKGIPKQRLETESFGLTKPIASNKTREGRAENRRVHLNPLE